MRPQRQAERGGAAGFGIPLGSRAKRGCASEKRGAPSYVHGPGAFPAVSASLPPDSEPGAAIPSRVRRAMHVISPLFSSGDHPDEGCLLSGKVAKIIYNRF